MANNIFVTGIVKAYTDKEGKRHQEPIIKEYENKYKNRTEKLISFYLNHAEYLGKDNQGKAQFDNTLFNVTKYNANPKLIEAIKEGADNEGIKLNVSGKQRTDTWVDEEGKTQYKPVIIANEVSIVKAIDYTTPEADVAKEQNISERAPEQNPPAKQR